MRLPNNVVPLLALGLGLAGCKSVVSLERTEFAPLAVTARPPAPPPKIEKIEIKDKIQFETGKATLKKQSFAILDEVVKVMQSRPTIKVQVEGHTDSVGDADKNRKLSQDRAESVMAYLVKKGIDKGRLTAKGFGPDRSVADNATEAGREANRRVEFLIVQDK
jgi:outer membrane protein OmpA-like peptidoglycan-associated protein